jgi:thymidylate synthase (FAD)
MTVRLIAITKPVINDLETTEQLLAFCARVSSTANQLNHETGPKLIASLIKRKEWSPLEMVSATVEIMTTRDIARQILRHRSFSFQEFSQRYAKVEDEYVHREARMQDHKDRQNSTPADDVGLAAWWDEAQGIHAVNTVELYDEALARGIAKEVARAVLPEGMTPSKLYMAGNLRSWIHYIMLRCDRKTQKEHQAIAFQVAWALCNEFPIINTVLDWVCDAET